MDWRRNTPAAYSDFGGTKQAPGADKIVFGQLENEDGFRVMAYDIPGQDDADSSAIAGSTHRENGATITDRTYFLSVRGETLDEVEGYWNSLSVAATIIDPLGRSPIGRGGVRHWSGGGRVDVWSFPRRTTT